MDTTLTPSRNYIQEVRKANGWSFQQMADEINRRTGGRVISHMGLNKIERRKHKPRLGTLMVLETAGEPFASMARDLMAEHYPEQPQAV